MSQERDIENYIRQNRNTYAREAITNNLLTMGHSREDVDRIWEIVEPISSAAPNAASGQENSIENRKVSEHPRASLVGIIPLWLAGLGFGLVYTYLFTYFGASSWVPGAVRTNSE